MYLQKREKFISVGEIMAYHRIPLGQCQESVNTREWQPCIGRGWPQCSHAFGLGVWTEEWYCMRVAVEAYPESEPGSQACHLLLNVSPLPRCSPPLQRCCRRRLPQRMTRHRANGAMVQRCGPLATKHAVPAAVMSLRDTMGPVRDTARMVQLSDSTLRGALRARSRGWGWPGQVTGGSSKCRHRYRTRRSDARP